MAEEKNRLKELRISKKLSGTEVAEAVNITAQYYYELEKGEKRLNEDILHKLADYYATTTDFLLGRTNVRTYPRIPAAHIDEEGPPVTEDALNQLEKIIKREREKIRREKEGK